MMEDTSRNNAVSILMKTNMKQRINEYRREHILRGAQTANKNRRRIYIYMLNGGVDGATTYGKAPQCK